MKIFKAFILVAAIKCSTLNQNRVRRQIDWDFINANDGDTDNGGDTFKIEKYIASVYVSDRYARTELALNVKNFDTSSQNYTFAVNLKDDEYISGLSLRIGKNGAVSTGDVHKEADAKEIFLQDKASPMLNFFASNFLHK